MSLKITISDDIKKLREDEHERVWKILLRNHALLSKVEQVPYD